MARHSHFLRGIFKEFDKIKNDTMENHLMDLENDGLFSILDQVPQIGLTKVSRIFFL